MTTLRHTIQQELFQPNEERLLCMCFVEKYLKKKKSSYLCIVSTTNPPLQISLVQVKQTDKTFKKKQTWPLPELKLVDGKAESNDTLEFDLHLDKVYRWVARSSQERQLFIMTLWKQCSKYISKDKPIFKNLPSSWVTEDVMTPESKFEAPLLGMENELPEEFQAITDKEQEDLNKFVH